MDTRDQPLIPAFVTTAPLKVYVATPTIDHPKDKAILFLPDVFGIEFINTQLLADEFAQNGFKVYAIDYFDGDHAPLEALSNPDAFDVLTWIGGHGQDVTRPILDMVVNALWNQGISQFAATGYCFGARYAFDLAFDKAIKVAAVAHPALLKVPEDFERFKTTGVPFLINSCEVDQRFLIEDQLQADAILGGGTCTSELHRRVHFVGCVHGFAVPGDVSIPKVKAGKEGAFRATVEFFVKHL